MVYPTTTTTSTTTSTSTTTTTTTGIIIAYWEYLGACITQSAEFYQNGNLMANPSGSGTSSGSFVIVPGDVLEVYHTSGIKGAGCLTATAVVEIPYLTSLVGAFDSVSGTSVTAYVSWTVSGSDDIGLYAGFMP